MNEPLVERLCDALDGIALVDPHTHIHPHAPACRSLADILTYHYYTELAHSAGLPRERIEQEGLDPKEKLARIIPYLERIDNTAQYQWLVEMCQTFFGFQDERITTANWEHLYDQAAERMAAPDWEAQVLRRSNLEKVFLTNDFDDPLEGWDTSRYVPCLRCDDLVFHLRRAEVQGRLQKATDVELSDVRSLGLAIGRLFEHFASRGARACAVSLPPDFTPAPVVPADVDAVLVRLFAGKDVSDDERALVSRFVFWTLGQSCAEFKLPFQLMVGVNRRVYLGGVYQGQDLFDQRTSLYQYRELFNAFPKVKFPISVLTSSQNQELVAYSWIFPNVYCFGHWWYSNVPTFIERDARARLQAAPKTKQVAWYSDVYKLEFALPKFQMYRRVLARILAEDFVLARGWREERAVELGRRVLRRNVEEVFGLEA
ncbi:MAG: glucuronate isomerase [Planctomycetes bacterium]|nr:glucuronate isomerase [Planctomycetota bacterium]